MVAYVHIEYSTYQFLEESKEGGGRIHPPPRHCGTENKVLRGLRIENTPYSLLETSTTPSTTTPTTSPTTSAPPAMNKILYIDGKTGTTTLGNHTLINVLIRKIEPG